MYNTRHAGAQGVVSGLHVRGPQLNPQRDPRWCDHIRGNRMTLLPCLRCDLIGLASSVARGLCDGMAGRGRNDNSPGEDAYLEGQYGAWMVLGGQGADLSGRYRCG
jgi:hypothetical protein